jgi:hypothetical protein
MALTPEGTPYVESTDLVANYPAASLSLANRVDLVGVLPFADSAARSAAIPSPTDGQFTYLQDTNTPEFYDGASFVPIAGGKILQVVSVIKNSTFSTSSTSFVDITGMAATITPASTGSKILALVQMQTASSTNSQIFWVNLLRGATLIAQPAAGSNPSTQTRRVGPSVNDSSNVGITFLDSPATVSATTYKLQIKVDGGVAYVNSLLSSDYSSVSTFTLMEVSA